MHGPKALPLHRDRTLEPQVESQVWQLAGRAASSGDQAFDFRLWDFWLFSLRGLFVFNALTPSAQSIFEPDVTKTANFQSAELAGLRRHSVCQGSPKTWLSLPTLSHLLEAAVLSRQKSFELEAEILQCCHCCCQMNNLQTDGRYFKAVDFWSVYPMDTCARYAGHPRSHASDSDDCLEPLQAFPSRSTTWKSSVRIGYDLQGRWHRWRVPWVGWVMMTSLCAFRACITDLNASWWLKWIDWLTLLRLASCLNCYLIPNRRHGFKLILIPH